MALLPLSGLITIFILHEETKAWRDGDLEVVGLKPGFLTPGLVSLSTLVSGQPIPRHQEGERKVEIGHWGDSTLKIH